VERQHRIAVVREGDLARALVPRAVEVRGEHLNQVLDIDLVQVQRTANILARCHALHSR